MTGFSISFAARHRSRDLSGLLTHLGIVPKHCWQAGDQRRAPNGLILEGSYDLSYASCDLPLPDSDDLADWLAKAIVLLRPFAEQLVAFTDDGGSLSFYIGLEKGVFEGTTLTPELLAELAELRMSLDIDRNL